MVATEMIGVEEAARRAGLSMPTFRRWAWKLNIRPEYKLEEIQTKKGRRVVAKCYYTVSQIESIKNEKA